MKTRLLIIIIGIVLASISSGAFAYYIQVQSTCESIPGYLHNPRMTSWWECLEYLNIIEENKQAPPFQLIDTFKEKYSKYEIIEYPDSKGIPWKYSVNIGGSDVELIFGEERVILRSYGTSDGNLICTVINPFHVDVMDACPPKW